MTVPGLRHAAVLVAAVAVVSLAACGGNSAASSEPTTGESTAGQPITTATAISEQAPDEYGCAYSSADDSVQVEVQVSEHDAASSYGTFLAGSPGASTVGGLGDKAFFDNERTMYVLAGNNLIQVNGLNTADESAALARPILAAL